MTTPNYFGWMESQEAIEMRSQERMARELSYEVFNASTLTDEEIDALDKALEACSNDPAHIAVATEHVNSDMTKTATWIEEAEAEGQEFRDVKFGSKQWFDNIEEVEL